MQWVLTILIIVLIIIFFISAGLLTQASTKIGPNTTDPHLSYAYKITTWIAVLTWVIVALIIIGIIVYFFFYAEAAPEIAVANAYKQLQSKPETLSTGLTIFLVIIILLVLIVGILAAIAASSISNYSGYKTNADIYRAYEDSAISAVLCLGSLGILVGILIYYNWPSSKQITGAQDVPMVEMTTIKEAPIKKVVKETVLQSMSE
jgi:ABC-type sulfate transport system permease component